MSSAPASAVPVPAEQRVVLKNIRWSTYLAILQDSQSRGRRLAYDRGVLEIMSPSLLHENASRLIGRMVEAFTEEMGIEVLSSRSTTFKRADKQQGFEADESYYIANADAVRGLDEIDLVANPAPDLAIEVDISCSSLDKFTIYGGLGVPEVWRFDGQSLEIYVHLRGGDYQRVQDSAALPEFPVAEAVRLLGQRQSLGETQLIRSFRLWIRKHRLGA